MTERSRRRGPQTLPNVADDVSKAVTVAQAARLWEVSRVTVHRWIDQNKLRCFARHGEDALTAPHDRVMAAKVVKESEVLARTGLTAMALRAAVRALAIVAPPEGRYSLNDVDRLKSLSAKRSKPTPRVSAKDRVDAIQKYLKENQHPADLPDWFWETHQCPDFVPHCGVFYWFCSESMLNATGKFVESKYVTHVRRGKGWTLQSNGTAIPHRETAPYEYEYAIAGRYPRGATPPDKIAANQEYEAEKHIWEGEWHRRAKLKPKSRL